MTQVYTVPVVSVKTYVSIPINVITSLQVYITENYIIFVM